MSARSLLATLPIALFVLLALLLGFGLRGDPSKIPSPLIGKPAPEFSLPALEGVQLPGISRADLAEGGVTVVNVFASWCVPCRDEHPVLTKLAETGKARLVGINYKDNPANARQFLESLGNPYDAIGADAAGRATVDWGVYGVPETFIVDGKGIIRHKHVGPLTEDMLASEILPAIEKARN